MADANTVPASTDAALAGDFRLADFKALLPTGDRPGPRPRTLLIARHQPPWLPFLADDLGAVDVLAAGAAGARAQAVRPLDPGPDADGLTPGTGPGAADHAPPADGYDLILLDADAETPAAWAAARRLLAPYGLLCRLGDGAPDLGADWRPRGAWRAWPDWPAFRVLIPAHRAGWRAAARLRLFDWRTGPGLAARVAPGLLEGLLPVRGLGLYARAAAPDPASGHATASLLDALVAALNQTTAATGTALPPTAPDHWLIASGRLGPGNPILAFALDAAGRPRHLLKIARVAGADHLAAEAAQLAAIGRALAAPQAARLIRPRAAAVVADRHVLAYDFVPTRAFFGPTWRLRGRAGLCRAMADWLAALATQTRRPVGAAAPDSPDAPDAPDPLAPLRRLLARRVLPAAVAARAAAGLAAAERLALPLVLEHGDLGIYNLRLVSADGRDFRVLDWGSSTFDGVPVGDLGYLLCSAQAPIGLARRCLARYLDRLGLPPAAAAAGWYAYLARRWEELDGIRVPMPGDPTSGGGVLLPIEARLAPALAAFGGSA